MRNLKKKFLEMPIKKNLCVELNLLLIPFSRELSEVLSYIYI